MNTTLSLGRPAVEAGSRSRWYVLFILLIPSCLLMAADKQAMVVMAPQIQTAMSLDLVQMTRVIAASSLAYAFFQLPAGWLCETFGAPVMLAVACVIWSLSVLVTPLAGGVWGLIACRFFMGIGQAPDWTANMMVAKGLFETRLRAKIIAVLLSALSLGSVIGAPLSLKIMKTFDWRACFYLYGASGLLLSALLVFYALKSNKTRPSPVKPWKVRSGVRSWALFRSRQFHAVGLAYFCLLGVEGFFAALIPMYLTKVRGMPIETVGWVVSVSFGLIFVSKIVGGTLSDFLATRNCSLWWARVPMGAGGLLGGAILLCCGLSSAENSLALAFMFGSTFLFGFGQIAIWASVQDLGASGTGLIASWTQFLGNIAGAIVPISISLLVTGQDSWIRAEGLIVVLGLFGAGCLLLVKPQLPLVLDQGALAMPGA
ncbi:MAG: transporter, family, D-galactonate transporter [Mucilaginibacter sp.]|nr:transporter, family, D-galactonate transporter [Mucilaginibacter sp.]